MVKLQHPPLLLHPQAVDPVPVRRPPLLPQRGPRDQLLVLADRVLLFSNHLPAAVLQHLFHRLGPHLHQLWPRRVGHPQHQPVRPQGPVQPKKQDHILFPEAEQQDRRAPNRRLPPQRLLRIPEPEEADPALLAPQQVLPLNFHSRDHPLHRHLHGVHAVRLRVDNSVATIQHASPQKPIHQRQRRGETGGLPTSQRDGGRSLIFMACVRFALVVSRCVSMTIS